MEVYQGGKTGQTMRVPQLPKGIINKVIIGLVAVVVLIFGWSCFYIVEEQEEAAILTFGKYTDTQDSPGLHFKAPYPIQQVVIVPSKLEQKIHIGYRDIDGAEVPQEDEALMITGDENIVSADAVVEWNVADLQSYLYNIEDPETFLRNSAISAIRAVIGSTKLDYAITEGKTVIQTEVKAKLEELQKQYNTGINIIDLKFQDIEPPEGQVQQAFKEVTNAREEKNTKVNQAQKYVNDLLPKARGEAQALIEQAEAQKQSRILNAQGDVAKFDAIYTEYAKNPDVVSSRLIIETLEKVLPNAKVIVTDGGGDTVKYLPLNDFLRPSAGSASPSTPSNTSPSTTPRQPAASEGGTAQ